MWEYDDLFRKGSTKLQKPIGKKTKTKTKNKNAKKARRVNRGH